MRIEERTGDLLSVNSGIIIHGCNMQGVMGAGVAKALRSKYEGIYTRYRREYSRNNLKMGMLIAEQVTNSLCVVNAITQNNYGREPGTRYVDYNAIERAFTKAFNTWPDVDMHFPKIGCGLAGGEWEIVSAIIETAAKRCGFQGTLTLWKL